VGRVTKKLPSRRGIKIIKIILIVKNKKIKTLFSKKFLMCLQKVTYNLFYSLYFLFTINFFYILFYSERQGKDIHCFEKSIPKSGNFI